MRFGARGSTTARAARRRRSSSTASRSTPGSTTRICPARCSASAARSRNVGELEESERVLREAVTRFPDNAALRVFLALTRWERDDKAGPGASSSRRCSAPMRRDGPLRARDPRLLGRALSERLRLLLERAQSGYRLRDAATGRGRALGGPADPRRAGGGSVRSGSRRSTIRRSTRGGGSRSCPSRRTSTTRTRSGSGTRADAPARRTCLGRMRLDWPVTSRPFRSGGPTAGLRVPDRTCRRLDRAAQIDSAAVAYEFKLPDLGEGLTEGEVARWLVSEGRRRSPRTSRWSRSRRTRRRSRSRRRPPGKVVRRSSSRRARSSRSGRSSS